MLLVGHRGAGRRAPVSAIGGAGGPEPRPDASAPPRLTLSRQASSHHFRNVHSPSRSREPALQSAFIGNVPPPLPAAHARLRVRPARPQVPPASRSSASHCAASAPAPVYSGFRIGGGGTCGSTGKSTLVERLVLPAVTERGEGRRLRAAEKRRRPLDVHQIEHLLFGQRTDAAGKSSGCGCRRRRATLPHAAAGRRSSTRVPGTG